MFEKLKLRWKVNGINLTLIIITFALGGSACGYAGRKLLLLTGLEKGIAWFVLYLLLITLLWPLAVLFISIPLGQYAFFRKYILKIWNRISGSKNNSPVHIAIFASGTGSNAQQIIISSQAKKNWKVALIVCNKPGAGVMNIAAENNIPALLIKKDRFFNGDCYLPELQEHKIGFIVLAGFLWKLPSPLIASYPKKIVNIHPALLPKYGGKGMYGHKVHDAVITAREKESGISIHYVNDFYDQGETIFQASCKVDETDTADTLARKIHALEHTYYPRVIDSLMKSKIAVN